VSVNGDSVLEKMQTNISPKATRIQRLGFSGLAEQVDVTAKSAFLRPTFHRLVRLSFESDQRERRLADCQVYENRMLTLPKNGKKITRKLTSVAKARILHFPWVDLPDDLLLGALLFSIESSSSADVGGATSPWSTIAFASMGLP
jgi:hypothetical protein